MWTLRIFAIAALALLGVRAIGDLGHEGPLHPAPLARSTDAADRDRVTSLPGTDTLDFDLYSGYVTVDDDAGRALFYTLAESSSPHPAKDPLVLWLNGGPGCSSIGGGFLSELGPFYPTPTAAALVKNDYAWNQVANVLFVESPAFVGWSYSNRSADATVGDARTAADAHAFLLGFMDRFPRYRERPLWLAGESYAGHYLPQLAAAVLEGNRRAAAGDSAARRLNLKGFMLGNPWTDPAVDNRGAVQFWLTHGIISAAARDGMDLHCDFSRVGPLAAGRSPARLFRPLVDSAGALRFWMSHGIISDTAFRGAMETCDLAAIWPLAARARGGVLAVPPTPGAASSDDDRKCEKYIDMAMKEFERINIYDIYADVCLADEHRVVDAAAPAAPRPLRQPRYDPCIDGEVEAYLNRRDVQDALHANSTADGTAQPGPWVTCTPRIQYSRDDVLTPMIPVYTEQLLGAGLELLIYSGDVDAIVPVIGTRRWVRDLGLGVEEPWRAWLASTGQVGGWTVRYKQGLTFASVRGAGHMVPYTQAPRAFDLFSRFVHGRPL